MLLVLENPILAKETTTPIIAIGDLHADLESAKKVFQVAGVLNEKGEWLQDNIIVVQTGDLTDRGPDGYEVLVWIQRLEKEAKKNNSELHVLIGNHESMNLQGDWRYVSPADIDSFGGLEARKKAFMPGGYWSDWLLSKDAVLNVKGNIFVHGGVAIDFAKEPKELSFDVQSALRTRNYFDPVLGNSGPLWYRGYWQKSEDVACYEADLALKKMNAKRMIMGHTTQPDGKVHVRCNGKLIVIDTGISRHYGENVAAVRIDQYGVTAIYPDYSETLIEEKSF